MKKKKGFTLVEMMVVLAVTAVFGAIVVLISSSSGKMFAMTQRDSFINDEARNGLSVLTEDLRVGRNIDTSVVSLTGDDLIEVGGVNYTCKDIGLPVGSFKIILKINVKGETIYYVKAGKTVQRMKMGVGIFKTTNTISDIRDGGISKSLGDPTDKRYYISFLFEDSKGDTTPYETVVMPRN